MARQGFRLVVDLAGATISTITGLVIALEGLLSHDTELLRKLTKFARTFQLFLVAGYGYSFCGLNLVI